MPQVLQHPKPDGTLERLARDALPLDAAELAQFLLGKIVVRRLGGGLISGRIVETEAYLVGDAASHAFRGHTPRNGALFLARGHCYVYLAYGTSYMLNVAAGEEGVGTGVLVRALEPIAGIPAMQRHRGLTKLADLTRGPGRLAEALQIDRRLDGIDLCAAGPLWLGDDGEAPGSIGTSVRIGITKAAELPLRFFLRGNPFVSGPRHLNQ